MNIHKDNIRYCSRCGTKLPPKAILGICTSCALEEAITGARTIEDKPLALDDLTTELLSDEASDKMIGRYKLLEKVGEGGYGVVYVAEQQEPVRRRVALKVIKLGMDTRAVVARFEAERQALAMMDHPNIAKVLDAGTTEQGRPYFVMDLVRGIRITDYCDQAQLSTTDRLRLFIHVCQAIQHAHQKGIIHRDIKPSNILVTLHDGMPVPKVIDFGIAKATEGRLTDKTVYTQLHQFIGTPAYMSPEQAEMSGLDIDTRSDLYSLGVLLYELLTGRPPFDPKELVAVGLDRMRRTILEQEPVRPSIRLASMQGEELTTTAKQRSVEVPNLVHLVKGDLDWIVMKCLEKDRTRRYETADGLARDIQRHLDNEPVTACPPSASYRFNKMFQRNRKAFIATVIVVLALIVGFSAAIVGFMQAVSAQTKETQMRKKAETQELVSRQRAYAAEMNTAYHSLEENNLGHAQQLLERQRPKPGEGDLRGWEWRYLWQQCQPSNFDHYSGSFSSSAAYSPDGRWLAYHLDKKIVVRYAHSEVVYTNLPSYCSSLSFSSRTPLLAVADDQHVTLWSTETWQPVRRLPGAINVARFSPDGRWLATMGTNQFLLWDTATWEIKASCPGAVRVTWTARNVPSISQDSEYLVTPSWSANLSADVFRLWKLPNLEPVSGFEDSEEGVSTAAFSADGKYLLIGTAFGTLQVWDIGQRRCIHIEKAHDWYVVRVVTSKDGSAFVTCGDDTVAVWDSGSRKLVTRLKGHLTMLNGLDISPDGKRIASTGLDGTRVWSTDRNTKNEHLLGSSRVVGFTPDSQTLIAEIEDGLRLWDLATGATNDIRCPDLWFNYDYIKPGANVAMHPHKSLAALGKTNGSVEIWDVSSRTPQTNWSAHSEMIRVITFSPGGTQLATASVANHVCVWNLATQELIHQFGPLKNPITCLAFSPDGHKLMASGTSDTISVFDLVQGREQTPLTFRGGWAMDLAFSPDGALLAAISGQKASVNLVDAHSGKLRTVLSGPVQAMFGLAYSPDGRTLATGLNTKGVILWNPDTSQQIMNLSCDGGFESLCFSPDARTLAVGLVKGKKREIRLYHAPSLSEIESRERN